MNSVSTVNPKAPQSVQQNASTAQRVEIAIGLSLCPGLPSAEDTFSSLLVSC